MEMNAFLCAVEQAQARNGKRKYVNNKHQFCLYCDKGQLNLPRHLRSVHRKETDICYLVALKESGQEEKYKTELARIRNSGNFKHNIESLKQGKSDIVVVKRPTLKKKVKDFTPCPYCYGFYLKVELWRHTKKCVLKTESAETRTTLAKSQLLLQSSILDSHDRQQMSLEMQQLLASMHDDEFRTLIIKDVLLVQLGETLLKKYGPSKKNDISQRLRQLARLKRECMKKSGKLLHYQDLLCGTHYDLVQNAATDLCGLKVTAEGTRTFNIPSLAIRLGHLLKKVSVIKQGYCLRRDQQDGVQETESFLTLLRNEWTDAISSNALNTLKRRKDNQVERLPSTDDLMNLRKHMSQSFEERSTDLTLERSYSNWRRLAVLVMARLIIFNKRRGGEVSRTLAASYVNRPNWRSEMSREVTKSMAPLESKLVERLDLVCVPGKRRRKVPILIPADTAKPLQHLQETREQVHIPSSNPFLFASMSQNGHLDGWQALNSVTSEIDLQFPQLITSTKCQKHAATIMQLFDLTGQEQEWLSIHMGHSLNIEKEYYRLHESSIEITRIGKMLLKMDNGGGEESDEEEGSNLTGEKNANRHKDYTGDPLTGDGNSDENDTNMCRTECQQITDMRNEDEDSIIYAENGAESHGNIEREAEGDGARDVLINEANIQAHTTWDHDSERLHCQNPVTTRKLLKVAPQRRVTRESHERDETESNSKSLARKRKRIVQKIARRKETTGDNTDQSDMNDDSPWGPKASDLESESDSESLLIEKNRKAKKFASINKSENKHRNGNKTAPIRKK